MNKLAVAQERAVESALSEAKGIGRREQATSDPVGSNEPVAPVSEEPARVATPTPAPVPELPKIAPRRWA